MTIGACATAGGIQAFRNWADSAEFCEPSTPRPSTFSTLATSTAIGAHVPVDFELRGCPINKHQLLEVLTSLLAGRRRAPPCTASAWNANGGYGVRDGRAGLPCRAP